MDNQEAASLRIKLRERRNSRRKKGLCTTCGEMPAHEGRHICPPCLDKCKERSKKYRTETYRPLWTYKDSDGHLYVSSREDRIRELCTELHELTGKILNAS